MRRAILVQERDHSATQSFADRTGEEYNAYSSALCNFLNSPVTLSLLTPNIFLSNTLILCSSLKVRMQVHNHAERPRFQQQRNLRDGDEDNLHICENIRKWRFGVTQTPCDVSPAFVCCEIVKGSTKKLDAQKNFIIPEMPLESRLQFHPYRLQMLQALNQRTKCYEEISALIENDDEFIRSVVFSDVATFHLSGEITRYGVEDIFKPILKNSIVVKGDFLEIVGYTVEKMKM
ncbi:hypothetical protein ANN_14289 [Periplaneta americana]|uniref:Uncharacterized protein n=1 Tax=Periplaneta americana TaxID=6978 RepID=A0ABQ8SXG7_PERAM|nr:hypothetical protein ANN_14289 [Periplaneta americana]